MSTSCRVASCEQCRFRGVFDELAQSDWLSLASAQDDQIGFHSCGVSSDNLTRLSLGRGLTCRDQAPCRENGIGLGKDALGFTASFKPVRRTQSSRVIGVLFFIDARADV